MDKLFKDATLKEYIDELSSKEIVPGGGSVAALSASLAVGLNLMVINFSYKSDTSVAIVRELDKLKEDQSNAKDRLIQLIDEDSVVFKALMKSFSEKKDIQVNLKRASDVPFEICSLCEVVITVTEKMLEIGNKNLICDIGCACNFIKAALDSAALNVEVNTKHLDDKNLANEFKEKLKVISTKVKSKCEHISNQVTCIVGS